MLREWLDRLRARRQARLARDYGNLTAEERIELARLRDEEGVVRGRGLEESAGRRFDRELDAEEGRPPS